MRVEASDLKLKRLETKERSKLLKSIRLERASDLKLRASDLKLKSAQSLRAPAAFMRFSRLPCSTTSANAEKPLRVYVCVC